MLAVSVLVLVDVSTAVDLKTKDDHLDRDLCGDPVRIEKAVMQK